MPLIACPDCRRQVSNTAPACPHCGRPIAATTIEQTGKAIKAMKLIGGLVIVMGGITALGNPELGMLLLIAGLVIYLVGAVQRWWNHG